MQIGGAAAPSPSPRGGVGRYSRATRKKKLSVVQHQLKIPVVAAYRPPIPPLGCLFSFWKGLEELDVEHDEGTVRPAVVPRPEERTKERKKKTDNPREGWEDGTPRTHEAST